MIRVRACTIRCRCHSRCRRSRFSQLGTQICRKRSSSSNRRIHCASWRSVFCLPTRFVRISAASPIHSSKCNSESKSFEPARLSTGFHPHTYPHSLGREIAIKLFRFLAVLQSPFLELPSVGIHKPNLLKARVVVCSYNDHVRLLSPEPVGWIQHHQLYSSVGANIVMESITPIDHWSMSDMAMFQQYRRSHRQG